MNKNERLKEVSTEMLRESLLALADLRRKYKQEPMVTVYKASTEFTACACDKCPLCIFTRQYANTPVQCHCKACPWVWFTGHLCEAGKADYAFTEIKSRLAPVARWEKTINAELSAREAPHEA